METQVYRSLGGFFSCKLVSSWSLTGVLPSGLLGIFWIRREVFSRAADLDIANGVTPCQKKKHEILTRQNFVADSGNRSKHITINIIQTTAVE
jgi:hypothetical protein